MSILRAFSPLLLAGALAAATAPVTTPTFDRDVMPILQKDCQTCHRPGEVAPMSLMTYKETRPFAAAIKEAVSLRKMPPWFADPHYGHFTNDRALSQEEIDTLVSWAKNGAPEGDAKDLPPARQFVEGWNIQKPDLVLEMPAAFQIPSSGTIEYQYILVPGKFDRDTWVQMAEVRPGNRALLHHVIAFVRPPGSKWLASIQPGVPYVPKEKDKEESMNDGEFLVGYAPGLPPTVLPNGRAKLVKAGSDIIFQMHYTANGHEGTDLTKIGLRFAQEQDVKERILTMAAANGKFAIPPNAADYKVESEIEIATDTRLVDLLPHMHLRGKDFEYQAIYPTGERQTLLRVPNYSFSWQLVYVPQNDVVIPKGTKIHCIAHFDNSANNPANPDPSKKVTWGDQSWDEMMIGFFDVAFEKHMNPDALNPPREKKKESEPVKTANAAPDSKSAAN